MNKYIKGRQFCCDNCLLVWGFENQLRSSKTPSGSTKANICNCKLEALMLEVAFAVADLWRVLFRLSLQTCFCRCHTASTLCGCKTEIVAAKSALWSNKCLRQQFSNCGSDRQGYLPCSPAVSTTVGYITSRPSALCFRALTKNGPLSVSFRGCGATDYSRDGGIGRPAVEVRLFFCMTWQDGGWTTQS